jgi:N-acetylglucosamine kinase-like BadF-type ATPase
LADVFLGVDGGGSKTQALVTDESGRVLGRGLGPSSNHNNVGYDNTWRALEAAVEGALRPVLAAQGSCWAETNIAAACFGLAGVDSREDEQTVSDWLRRQGLKCKFTVLNDAELILAAGTRDGTGVALIAGTGSICLARARDGRQVRVGGWGHVLGDEGSAYQIAVDALREAGQAADGRGDSQVLLKAILRFLSLTDPLELMRTIYSPRTTPQDIADIAIPVLDLAGRGDAAALRIVERAGSALALHIDTAVRALALEKPAVALGGGALREVLRKSLLEKLAVEVGTVTTVNDPAQGAIIMARRLLAA